MEVCQPYDPGRLTINVLRSKVPLAYDLCLGSENASTPPPTPPTREKFITIPESYVRNLEKQVELIRQASTSI